MSPAAMEPASFGIDSWKSMLDLPPSATYRSPYESFDLAGASDSHRSHDNVLDLEIEPCRAESETLGNDACSGLAEQAQAVDAEMDELSMTDNQYKATSSSARSTSTSDQAIVVDHACQDLEPHELSLDLHHNTDQPGQGRLSPKLSNLQRLGFDPDQTASTIRPSHASESLQLEHKTVDVPIQPSQISLVRVNGSVLLEVKWASSLLPLHSCWGQWQPKFTSEPAIPTLSPELQSTAEQGEKRKRGRPVQRGRQRR